MAVEDPALPATWKYVYTEGTESHQELIWHTAEVSVAPAAA